MKTDRKICRWRIRYPLMTGTEIAKRVGCNRQYVSHILAKNGLNNTQPSYRKKVIWCKTCGIPTKKNVFCSNTCRQKWYWVDVECTLCKKEFKLVRSHIQQRFNRGMKNIFCSQKCYAKGQREGIVKKRRYGYFGRLDSTMGAQNPSPS